LGIVSFTFVDSVVRVSSARVYRQSPETESNTIEIRIWMLALDGLRLSGRAFHLQGVMRQPQRWSSMANITSRSHVLGWDTGYSCAHSPRQYRWLYRPRDLFFMSLRIITQAGEAGRLKDHPKIGLAAGVTSTREILTSKSLLGLYWRLSRSGVCARMGKG
jgi:hypothetical protein